MSEEIEPCKLPQDFFEDLKAIMRLRRLTQRGLAELLEVTDPYIHKLMTGEQNLTLGTMQKLAKALNCKLEVRLCI